MMMTPLCSFHNKGFVANLQRAGVHFILVRGNLVCWSYHLNYIDKALPICYIVEKLEMSCRTCFGIP